MYWLFILKNPELLLYNIRLILYINAYKFEKIPKKIIMTEHTNNIKILEEDGWQFVTISGGDHLKHTLEMYRELGIDTRLVEVDPGSCEDCLKCFTSGNEVAYRIYIKPLKK